MTTARACITAAAIAAAVMATVGCGSSGKSYSASDVASCLRGKNFEVSRADADYIAQANDGFYVHTSPTASTYGLRASANVSFGDTKTLKETYAAFGSGREDTIGNALVVWDDYSETAGQILLDCFK